MVVVVDNEAFGSWWQLSTVKLLVTAGCRRASGDSNGSSLWWVLKTVEQSPRENPRKDISRLTQKNHSLASPVVHGLLQHRATVGSVTKPHDVPLMQDREWSSTGVQGQGKWEIPEKIHRPAASSSMIPTCKNQGVTQPGIEPSKKVGARSPVLKSPDLSIRCSSFPPHFVWRGRSLDWEDSAEAHTLCRKHIPCSSPHRSKVHPWVSEFLNQPDQPPTIPIAYLRLNVVALPPTSTVHDLQQVTLNVRSHCPNPILCPAAKLPGWSCTLDGLWCIARTRQLKTMPDHARIGYTAVIMLHTRLQIVLAMVVHCQQQKVTTVMSESWLAGTKKTPQPSCVIPSCRQLRRLFLLGQSEIIFIGTTYTQEFLGEHRHVQPNTVAPDADRQGSTWTGPWQNGVRRIWRERGNTRRVLYIIPQIQQGGGSKMFWGRIMYGHRTPLIVVEGNMTVDNVRLHSAHLVSNFLREAQINQMEWPVVSANMNPIEHAWDQLKQEMRRCRNPPLTLADLRRAAVKEWDRIEQDSLNHLVDNMPRKVRSCFTAGGGITPY
ncbi:hypothetical protein PR048_025124 [Dryococelus australis]|uniref:Tc1-like transposase DDE domain-containing protein n=1 Tax=Dryococelus australis TaxID=614101 RepID=A0ABQ9GQI0_9NEOP|nr:hypothetical protein PR048_025124 [Dryococelus australis]